MKRRLFAGFTLFTLLLAFAAVGHTVSDPPKRFIDNNNGTITDTTTGLVWQTGDGTQRNLQAATDYCNNNTAGLPGSGWRLPNIEELKSIFGDNLFNSAGAYYWSAWDGPSPTPTVRDGAWVMNISSGNTHFKYFENYSYVRCVR